MQESDALLIAVDIHDRETGAVGKMAAHRKGILHRAFSIFVFDDADRLLLQRRATGKCHSGGLWSNTCCGHPNAGESLLGAAQNCAWNPVSHISGVRPAKVVSGVTPIRKGPKRPEDGCQNRKWLAGGLVRLVLEIVNDRTASSRSGQEIYRVEPQLLHRLRLQNAKANLTVLFHTEPPPCVSCD